MKPATKKTDAAIWKLRQAGVAPKDIAPQLSITLPMVYKGIYREKRRRNIPLLKGVGRRSGKNGKRLEKRGPRSWR